MNHGAFCRALVVAILAFAPAALAQSPAPPTDLRCLILVNKLVAGDAEQKEAGIRLSYYFLGRIHGVSPSIDLTKNMAAEVQTMVGLDDSALRDQSTACVGMFENSADALAAAGEALNSSPR